MAIRGVSRYPPFCRSEIILYTHRSQKVREWIDSWQLRIQMLLKNDGVCGSVSVGWNREFLANGTQVLPTRAISEGACDMIQQFSISSLSELVRYIEDQCSEQSTVFFRGQRTDEPLRPSIARLNPKRYSLLEAEKKILRAFQRRSLPFLEMRPETTWDWLAVAQHYGAPTRLLDWSVSALSAVWFAVERPAVRDERENGGLRAGVIWIFHARDKVMDQGEIYQRHPGERPV